MGPRTDAKVARYNLVFFTLLGNKKRKRAWEVKVKGHRSVSHHINALIKVVCVYSADTGDTQLMTSFIYNLLSRQKKKKSQRWFDPVSIH